MKVRTGGPSDWQKFTSTQVPILTKNRVIWLVNWANGDNLDTNFTHCKLFRDGPWPSIKQRRQGGGGAQVPVAIANCMASVNDAPMAKRLMDGLVLHGWVHLSIPTETPLKPNRTWMNICPCNEVQQSYWVLMCLSPLCLVCLRGETFGQMEFKWHKWRLSSKYLLEKQLSDRRKSVTRVSTSSLFQMFFMRPSERDGCRGRGEMKKKGSRKQVANVHHNINSSGTCSPNKLCICVSIEKRSFNLNNNNFCRKKLIKVSAAAKGTWVNPCTHLNFNIKFKFRVTWFACSSHLQVKRECGWSALSKKKNK